MATIDGKQIVNRIYHAGAESMLIIGYLHLTKKTEHGNTKSRTWETLECSL